MHLHIKVIKFVRAIKTLYIISLTWCFPGPKGDPCLCPKGGLCPKGVQCQKGDPGPPGPKGDQGIKLISLYNHLVYFELTYTGDPGIIPPPGENFTFIAILNQEYIWMHLLCSKIHLLFFLTLLKIFIYYSLQYHLAIILKLFCLIIHTNTASY